MTVGSAPLDRAARGRAHAYAVASMNGTLAHRHGAWTHEHHHHGPHRHLRLPFRSATRADPHHHALDCTNDHAPGHGHTHGPVDPMIVRSRAGVRAVGWSLAVLGATAGLQALVFALSSSVALLADLIHNTGDALTAIPLGVAFLLASRRAERWAGYAVVGTILVSALVAAYEAIDRLVHPRELDSLVPLALAGVVGFVGNEIAARIRLRAGHALNSPALVADGHHARVDGYVSLGVVASAGVVSVGLDVGDPIIGLGITVLILRITWQAWHTIRARAE